MINLFKAKSCVQPYFFSLDALTNNKIYDKFLSFLLILCDYLLTNFLTHPNFTVFYLG